MGWSDRVAEDLISVGKLEADKEETENQISNITAVLQGMKTKGIIEVDKLPIHLRESFNAVVTKKLNQEIECNEMILQEIEQGISFIEKHQFDRDYE